MMFVFVSCGGDGIYRTERVSRAAQWRVASGEWRVAHQKKTYSERCTNKTQYDATVTYQGLGFGTSRGGWLHMQVRVGITQRHPPSTTYRNELFWTAVQAQLYQVHVSLE